MHYSEFAELYDSVVSTTKKLEKTAILAEFLKKLSQKGRSEWIYLLRGKVLADYDPREFGISTQLSIKAIAYSYGVPEEQVGGEFKKIGDLGEVAEKFAGKRNQSVLFSGRLSVDKLFNNLKKIVDIEGKGAVEKKMQLVSELLTSASSKEAKYVIRTLMNDLKVGVADALLIDAITLAFLSGDESKTIVQEKYDLVNDFALIFDMARKGINELKKVDIIPGRAMNVMLAVKAESIEDAFRICGRPAALEFKYDGFRMLINKKNGKISLFTRRLENVTLQFPDVVKAVEKYIDGDNFILDAEVVGYDKKTKRYMPFEAISQRIKRKYEIEKLIEQLPVEINVFDVLCYKNEDLMPKKFVERRKIVEKIVKAKEWIIKPSEMKIVESEKEAEEFYERALKTGEEGIMIKNIESPYKQGRKVGYMAKLKPSVNDIDLIIVGAEYGTGKRGGWLTSYVVACKDGDEFLEVGKVSSGLKEKEEEGTSYDEMTKLLKPLVIEEYENGVKVKPKIVVSVTYQNIQESPSYGSGYALRFPRITHYRPDRNYRDIASLDDIKREAKKGKR